LCAGKLWYELDGFRREHARTGVALVRVEQPYPYPGRDLRAALDLYPGATEVVWAQEEPRNMGAWGFVAERLGDELPPGKRLRYVGRPRSASPATGSNRRHVAEQEAVVTEVFADLAPLRS
jgi:2-oxoglutarate dehydrogenase complex dehydrogenase (E1) component-like enzyme